MPAQKVNQITDVKVTEETYPDAIMVFDKDNNAGDVEIGDSLCDDGTDASDDHSAGNKANPDGTDAPAPQREPSFFNRQRLRFLRQSGLLKCLEVTALLCTIIALPVAIVVPIIELRRDSPAPAPAPAPLMQPKEFKCNLLSVMGSTRGGDYFEEASCGDALATGSLQSRGTWLSLQGDGSHVTLSTCNDVSDAGYDTRIRVYHGSTFEDLECVAGNDDDETCAHGKRFSTVKFTADLGVTYFILVDGLQPQGGDFLMNIQCRPFVSMPSPALQPMTPNPTSRPITASPTRGAATDRPTPAPADALTAADALTDEPTDGPNTLTPTKPPTNPPTDEPTDGPNTLTPTKPPTNPPTDEPTPKPTPGPTPDPTAECTPTELLWILPKDGAAVDGFGRSVAISGDTAIVGADLDDDNGLNSGSVYIFARSGRTWAEEAKLLPSDGVFGKYFGVSVAISGDTAIVGAWGDEDNGFRSGAAYIFVRTGEGTWVQVAKLLPKDGAAHDSFGISVSISGDTAIVGAWSDDNKNGSDSGAAYIFVRSGGGTWYEVAKLLPTDGAANDWFGISVAIAGDTAIVGAWLDDDNGSDSGSAYIFVRSGGTWAEEAKLLPKDGAAGDHFGERVAIEGDTAIIGAPLDRNENGEMSGSAYLFVRSGERTWTEVAKLLPKDRGANDWFGISVSISGDTAVVGARQSDFSPNEYGAGYASVFIRTGGTWVERPKLVSENGAIGEEFGTSVAVDGHTIVVGATGANVNGEDSGASFTVVIC